jgi:hypothetical protein
MVGRRFYLGTANFSQRVKYGWWGAAVAKPCDLQADLPSIAIFPEPLARHLIGGFFLIPCRYDPCLLSIPAPMWAKLYFIHFHRSTPEQAASRGLEGRSSFGHVIQRGHLPECLQTTRSDAPWL